MNKEALEKYKSYKFHQALYGNVCNTTDFERWLKGQSQVDFSSLEDYQLMSYIKIYGYNYEEDRYTMKTIINSCRLLHAYGCPKEKVILALGSFLLTHKI